VWARKPSQSANCTRISNNLFEPIGLPPDGSTWQAPERRSELLAWSSGPSPATVAALIKKIPKRKLITTNLLCKELTDQFKVRGTCPVTAQKALQAIAHGSSKNNAYWRVINTNGGLIARFPDGAALLVEEGFTIDTKGKVSKVKNFKESLVRFD
jgi:hypothetical protein